MFGKFFGAIARLFGSNPKRRGRRVTLAALLAFNSENDAKKFAEIRRDLGAFLASGRSIEMEAVHLFATSAAAKLNVNPVLFKMILADLVSEMEGETGGTNARLFVEGVVEALDLVAT